MTVANFSGQRNPRDRESFPRCHRNARGGHQHFFFASSNSNARGTAGSAAKVTAPKQVVTKASNLIFKGVRRESLGRDSPGPSDHDPA